MKIQDRDKLHEPLTKEKMEDYRYAKSITFKSTTRTFILLFENKEVISFPVDEYKEFKNISDEDLKLAKIGFAGTAICLEKHDLHVLIYGLIVDLGVTNNIAK